MRPGILLVRRRICRFERPTNDPTGHGTIFLPHYVARETH